MIAKLGHQGFGQAAERTALLGLLERQLFEIKEDVAQAKTAAKLASRERRCRVQESE